MAVSTANTSTNFAWFWPGTSGGTIIATTTQTSTQYRVTIDLGGGVTYDIMYFGSGFT